MSAASTTTTPAARDPRLRAELVQLEAWAQEELAAQQALGRALGIQEAAIRAGDTAGLVAGTEAVEAAMRESARRERRRLTGLRALARRFGVAAETLTLASVAERAAAAGEDVERLQRARAELRAAAADALRRGRRIASLARHHRALVDDLIRELAGRAPGGPAGGPDAALVVDRRA